MSCISAAGSTTCNIAVPIWKKTKTKLRKAHARQCLRGVQKYNVQNAWHALRWVSHRNKCYVTAAQRSYDTVMSRSERLEMSFERKTATRNESTLGRSEKRFQQFGRKVTC